MYPKMFWEGFEGKDVKIYPLTPRQLPCVNTRLLVHRVSKSVQRPISARLVEFFAYKQRKKETRRALVATPIRKIPRISAGGWQRKQGCKVP